VWRLSTFGSNTWNGKVGEEAQECVVEMKVQLNCHLTTFQQTWEQVTRVNMPRNSKLGKTVKETMVVVNLGIF
jgi:hypothetical protein